MTLLLFPVSLLNKTTLASTPSSGSWIQTYGSGTSKDKVASFIQCADGGYLLAGSTNVSTTPPRSQLWLLKTDSSGKVEWNKTYGQIGSAIGRCIIQTGDGGYCFDGQVNSAAEVIKIDSNGNVQWDKQFSDAKFAYDLIETSDGGFALVGSTGGSGPSLGDDFWFVKISGSGETQWAKSYPQTSGSASSATETLDGGFALIGTTEANSDFLLVKTDSKGVFEWKKTYDSNDMDGGYSIVQNSDGSYVMAGLLWNRTTFSSGSMGVGLVKADSLGNLLWLRNYPGSGSPSSMIKSRDGSYMLCSSMLDKIDASGNLVWSRNVSFDGNLVNLYAGTTSLVVQTSDGGYAVAGTVSSHPTDPMNTISYVWIGKLDSDGNKIGFVPELSWAAIVILLFVGCCVVVASKKRFLKPHDQSNNRRSVNK
jgi:hypothetical protein